MIDINFDIENVPLGTLRMMRSQVVCYLSKNTNKIPKYLKFLESIDKRLA